MIRLLAAEEAARLLPCGRAFWKEAGFLGDLHEERFVRAIASGISGGYRLVLVMEEGENLVATLGAVLAECDYTGDLLAIENFYYALPQARGHAKAMMREFERLSKERGAKRIWMVHLASLSPERMARWYERLGYRPREIAYEKAI